MMDDLDNIIMGNPAEKVDKATETVKQDQTNYERIFNLKPGEAAKIADRQVRMNPNLAAPYGKQLPTYQHVAAAIVASELVQVLRLDWEKDKTMTLAAFADMFSKNGDFKILLRRNEPSYQREAKSIVSALKLL
jgi:hypothetical protein